MQQDNKNIFNIHPQCIDSSVQFQNAANRRVEEFNNNLNPVEFERKRMRNMVLATTLILGASTIACGGTMYLINILGK